MLRGIEGHEITHALEDLPADARAQLADVASLPAGVSLRQRIVDELENAGLDSYGELERVPFHDDLLWLGTSQEEILGLTMGHGDIRELVEDHIEAIEGPRHR